MSVNAGCLPNSDSAGNISNRSRVETTSNQTRAITVTHGLTTADDHTSGPTLITEPSRESSFETVTVVLALDGLKEHKFFGGGCCAVAAADAIEQELRSWPFVIRATVDEASNEITLSLARRDSDVDAIVEVLESMGYAATVQVAPSPTVTPS